MIIIPAIDLIDGKCVRLYQGDFTKTSEVASDPKSQLMQFVQDRAQIVHIVDLDGARVGKPVQFELIQELVALSPIPIQVGGGIRNIETVERYLESGVSRIVLGTSAIEDRSFLKEALSLYPESIVIGIDAKQGKVATHGWINVSELDYIQFAKEMKMLGATRIVFTDISRDGAMQGPNLAQLEALLTSVSCTIVASGGIRDLEDIRALDKIGIQEAIVGKAIYEGRVRLSEVTV